MYWEQVSQPIAAEKLTVQIKIEGNDGYQTVTLNAFPLKDEKTGSSSHFVGASDFLKTVGAFTAYLRIPIDTKTYRAVVSVPALDDK